MHENIDNPLAEFNYLKETKLPRYILFPFLIISDVGMVAFALLYTIVGSWLYAISFAVIAIIIIPRSIEVNRQCIIKFYENKIEINGNIVLLNDIIFIGSDLIRNQWRIVIDTYKGTSYILRVSIRCKRFLKTYFHNYCKDRRIISNLF